MYTTNEDDLKKMLLNAPMGVCVLNAADLVAEMLNEKFIEISGKPREAILGKWYWEPFAEVRAYYESALAGVVATGEAYHADEVEMMLIRHGQEEMVFVTFVYTPIKNTAGQVSKIVVWVTENTRQVREREKNLAAKTAVQKERDRLKEFFMQAPAGICVLQGPEFVFELVNPLYQQLFPGRDLLGKLLLEALPELNETPIIGILEQVYKSGESFEGNELLVPLARTADGPVEDRYFNFSYQPRRGTDDQIDGIQVFVIEVTGMIRIQQQLIEAREQAEQQRRVYETITSGTPDLMYVWDLNYRFTYANSALLSMWGKTWETAVGKTLLENGYEPWHAAMHEREIDSIIVTKQSVRGEVAFPHATLGKRIYDYILVPVLNEQDEVEAVAGTTRDVTERKQMEESLAETTDELQAINEELAASNEEIRTTNEELFAANERLNESQDRFRFLLNAIPQQVWTASADGALDYVNQVVSDDFGRDGEVVVGQGWQEFVHPDDLPLALESWTRSLQTNKEYVTEFRLRFADDQYYWHLARALPLMENGKTALWIGTNTNIHQQKTTEHQKDEFLSIASHELKTPLTTVKAFFQLTKRELGERSKIGGFIGKAERQLDRLGRLIEDLLDVSKINAGKMVYNKSNFEFNAMLAEAVDAMQETTTEHNLEFQSVGRISYHGDQHRIEQVVINLLNNAIKYSPDCKQVVVRCELEGSNIIVSVQDFGIGIADEHLKGLFDRFYRVDNSSARFQGLGLGLFISAEIVKRHGGSFWIESQPGEGSTFSFLLPLSGTQEFSDIATDDQSFYEGSFITIRYKPEGHYMDVNWNGYQNYDSVVKGCTIMLDLMQKNDCKKVLNDNSLVKGNWSEASDWGADYWFPAMATAGLKKFAWIYSPSTFSRIAANVSLPSEYDAVQVAFFNNKQEALDWLVK